MKITPLEKNLLCRTSVLENSSIEVTESHLELPPNPKLIVESALALFNTPAKYAIDRYYSELLVGKMMGVAHKQLTLVQLICEDNGFDYAEFEEVVNNPKEKLSEEVNEKFIRPYQQFKSSVKDTKVEF